GDLSLVTFQIGPDTRDVWVTIGTTFQQSALGDGQLTLTLVDVTGGGIGKQPATPFRLPNSTAAGIKTVVATTQPVRLGPLTDSRIYKVTASISAPSGTPAVNILNNVSNPSWMR